MPLEGDSVDMQVDRALDEISRRPHSWHEEGEWEDEEMPPGVHGCRCGAGTDRGASSLSIPESGREKAPLVDLSYLWSGADQEWEGVPLWRHPHALMARGVYRYFRERMGARFVRRTGMRSWWTKRPWRRAVWIQVWPGRK